ncbi:TIGR03086 family metal-binding protein [Kibdelosporangium aridum]|uniref:TIGR03086 family metal-binding protein n=1 Tax=Kibdelosporangium aridum TaxID=2030 RepID=UPI0005249490
MARQRQDYFDALGWVTQLMTAVQTRHLDARTPCENFDVRSLMGHLIGTAHRGLATARRVPTQDIPHVITSVPDAELAPTYATLSTSIREAWSPLAGADAVIPPWGPCTALEAARGFTVETITHGWDLAVATGQPSDAPNGIADRCLSYAAAIIPDRLRGVSYDAPVVAAGTFSTTEQLAHLLGHKRARIAHDSQ